MNYQQYYNARIQNTRLVDTGLIGKSAYEILESVVAQLSDGLGENNYYFEKFWNFVDVLENPNNHKVEIRISNLNCKRSGSFPKRWLFNPFLSQTDKEIKKWFARKIKQIAKIEAQDKHQEFTFKDNNFSQMEYLGDGSRTVAQAVEVYKNLIKEA
jgi:hypothetical protein